MHTHYSPVITELLKLARQKLPAPSEKSAFIDQAGLGGGGAPPPGGDPAAMGGAPPPGAAGDPASAGAPPPPPPGGGGGIDPMQLQQMIQTAVQGAMGGQGGGAAGGLKPKIDVNVELMQIKNMLAKLCDQSGIQIPAQEMVATSEKLNQMAAGGGAGGGAPAAAGGGGAPPSGAIPPIEPIQPAGKQAGYVDDGIAYGRADVAAASMAGISHKARAVAALLSRQRS